MKKCNKKVFVKILQKYKPCLRSANHSGWCVADLTEEVFGHMKVIGLGKPINGNNYWILDKLGKKIKVRAVSLMSGKFKGVNRGFCQKDNKPLAEYHTVRGHHYLIFTSVNPRHKNYKGMPFHEAWDPRKGGSISEGVAWILENLGPKPGPNWSMDIIEHKKGFVPGNIRWAYKYLQARNKIHRTLGRFNITELKIEAMRRGYKLVKI